ncbi:MAG: hypothetical protein DHS20C15_05090 [Planctomycetota bacterium]|nr:MAG: hypothetical protein DHS20C15_05090 [Planctomycetota bacterium]
MLLLALVLSATAQSVDGLPDLLPPSPAPRSTASAPGRPTPDAGAAELAALGALLHPLLEHPDWPADLWLALGGPDEDVAEVEARNPLPAVSARLALFERRFGKPPRESLGWEAFQALAEQLHRRMESASPEHAGGVALSGLAAVEPPWLTARSLLLELVGRGDDAQALLLHESGRWLWPGHWMVEAQLTYDLCRARALQLDRSGQPAAAQLWSLAAWSWGTSDPLADDFNHHRVGLDWVLAHHAVLLAEAGEGAAARTLLSDLEHWRPEAEGTRLARQMLADLGPAAASPGPRLFEISTRADARDGSVFLVGEPGDPATWRALGIIETLRAVARPGQEHSGAELRALAPDDPRAAPLLEALPKRGVLRR